MEKKTKILFWILAIATFVSIILTFNRSFITRDYEIIPVVDDIVE